MNREAWNEMYDALWSADLLDSVMEALKRKSPRPRKGVIAVDFDGVLYEADGSPEITGDPVDGAAAAMSKFGAAGYTIIVHSVRAHNQIAEMCSWLRAHGIHYDYIWGSPRKPYADVYISTDAYFFDGEWTSVVPWMLEKLGRKCETQNEENEKC